MGFDGALDQRCDKGLELQKDKQGIDATVLRDGRRRVLAAGRSTTVYMDMM